MFKPCKQLKLGAFTSAILMALMLTACDEQQPVKGFVLPEGNVDLGKQVFIDNECYQCHTMKSETFPERGPNPAVTLELGGKVYRVKDYGELLDAVVNPSHIISPKYLMTLDKEDRKNAETPMPNLTEQITVAELIDLVAFLHAQYSKMDPQFYRGYSRVR
jgi:mono/diheme cytochrome c family protein